MPKGDSKTKVNLEEILERVASSATEAQLYDELVDLADFLEELVTVKWIYVGYIGNQPVGISEIKKKIQAFARLSKKSSVDSLDHTHLLKSEVRKALNSLQAEILEKVNTNKEHLASLKKISIYMEISIDSQRFAKTEKLLSKLLKFFEEPFDVSHQKQIEKIILEIKTSFSSIEKEISSSLNTFSEPRIIRKLIKGEKIPITKVPSKVLREITNSPFAQQIVLGLMA